MVKNFLISFFVSIEIRFWDLMMWLGTILEAHSELRFFLLGEESDLSKLFVNTLIGCSLGLLVGILAGYIGGSIIM